MNNSMCPQFLQTAADTESSKLPKVVLPRLNWIGCEKTTPSETTVPASQSVEPHFGQAFVSIPAHPPSPDEGCQSKINALAPFESPRLVQIVKVRFSPMVGSGARRYLTAHSLQFSPLRKQNSGEISEPEIFAKKSLRPDGLFLRSSCVENHGCD